VDLTARPDMTAENAILDVSDRDLSRYDLIVVIVGVNDALKHTAPDAWRVAMSTLLSAFLDVTSKDTRIVVVGIHPIRSISAYNRRLAVAAERDAVVLNRVMEDLCAESERTVFTPLPTPTATLGARDRHRTPRQYDQWGQVLADTAVPLLTARHELASARRQSRGTPLSAFVEADRQEVVDELVLHNPDADERLQQILSLARQAFRANSAMVTILDHDQQWQLAGAGPDRMQGLRCESFCDIAIQGDEAMVVPDAQRDDRFSGNPMVVDEPHIRFYAGFPIESPSNHRIGALCVVDPQPRHPGEIDLVFLKELAHMAQHELWQFLPGAREA
jgi:hypothetical protein